MAEAAPAPEPSFREQADAAETADANAPPTDEQVAPPPPPEGDAQEPVAEKTVPLAALHQERAASKELKRQIRESQAQMAAFQQQQVEMMRYMQSQQQQPQIPQKADDPLGYTVAGIEHVAQRMSAWEQQQANDRQAQHQAQQFEHFRSAVGQTEVEFAQRTPDYHEAIKWAKDRKIAEYMAGGMPEEYAKQRLQAEVFQLSQMAFDNGETPAEAAYRMAKAIGYRNRGVSAEQKLEMQRNGQAATMPGGGGVSGGKVSLEALSKLSGNDFLEATKGDNWRKVMSKS